MDEVKGPESTAGNNKGGRPKKIIRRSEIMVVRLTVSERLHIENKARNAGIKPSEWFRQAAKNAKIIPRITPEQTGYLRAMTGIANNLNQSTKLAHQVGLLSVIAEHRRLLGELDRLIRKLLGDDR
ncbi:plasmid mobilization relaxosome protein MobC [Parapusillimonas sp. SGNA-6]|uniref:plasmid mobilization protein n=1 Tax=Parapedobacter sp. SGR-10 TaxID=2710879 RepID=UPI0013D3C6BF|nr:plasmid mobilization relaxosome protein MobC [Parapedobacter sp. SGR-10]NGF54886.1 plasmid mobilization relaxosome protein MobC [Parapedobacter sp. SGR-10]NGM89353.1 plasmid mobilization relaxosome protein MobC [Parapusillimonas sp. SGNA-6]